MDCSRMDQWLDEWMDGVLSESELSELEGHATNCVECAGKLEAARQLKTMLSELPEELDVPLESQLKWRNAVKAEARHAKMRRLYRFAGAAAAVLVCAFGAFYAFKPNAARQLDAAQPMAMNDTVVMSESAAAGSYVMKAAEAAPEVFAVEADGEYAEQTMMLDDEEIGVAAYAEPMREVNMSVQKLDEACAAIEDLAGEYEGSFEAQNFESDGAACANLYIRLPGENADDFMAAALGLGEAEPFDAGSFKGESASILLVLREAQP